MVFQWKGVLLTYLHRRNWMNYYNLQTYGMEVWQIIRKLALLACYVALSVVYYRLLITFIHQISRKWRFISCYQLGPSGFIAHLQDINDISFNMALGECHFHFTAKSWTNILTLGSHKSIFLPLCFYYDKAWLILVIHFVTILRDGNYRLSACPGQVKLLSDM